MSGLPDEADPVVCVSYHYCPGRLLWKFLNFGKSRMTAIRAHESQFYQAESVEPATRISAPGFLEEIEYRMRYYGSLIGVRAGEAFYVREALNVDDPVALLTRPMNIYS